ncbi:MAG: hypothetical protein ACTSWY_11225, partial [Promethearchaeota archaeon]
SITVTAINGAEESEHSDPLIITVVLTPTITTSSQTIYTEEIIVAWSEVVGVDSYNVYVNGTFNASTSSLQQIINLDESGIYSITVTGVFGGEESEQSNPIIVTVLLIPPDSPAITTLSQTISFNNITLQWTTVERADSYKIYVNGTLNGTLSTLEMQIMFIANGEYVITVTAVNEYGESDPSSAITIIIDIPSSVEGGIPGYSPVILVLMLISFTGIYAWFNKKKTKNNSN